MATIFAWTGALRKRGELDNIKELCDFADKLEKASTLTIEEGIMTKDLGMLSKVENKKIVNTQEFLNEIRVRLDELIQ